MIALPSADMVATEVFLPLVSGETPLAELNDTFILRIIDAPRGPINSDNVWLPKMGTINKATMLNTFQTKSKVMEVGSMIDLEAILAAREHHHPAQHHREKNASHEAHQRLGTWHDLALGTPAHQPSHDPSECMSQCS